MQELPRSAGSLPKGLTLEKPTTGLASLAITDSMRQLSQVVTSQWRNKDAFGPLAKHGIHPIRQLLFYGPPGNGKTTACQWISGQLGIPLYRVRCEQLIGMYLGQSAANVSGIMEWCMRAPSAVVLFDEVESLFPSRDLARGECGRETSSAMAVYWQYLDRWTGPHLFVLATNMDDRLDRALKSRIELHLEFGPPTREQCHSVITYWAETLHEYGSATWAPRLLEQESFESFRALWQTIQRQVTHHITGGDQ